jgi:membrane-associated protease RseP (regulator of RpoE activity)
MRSSIWIHVALFVATCASTWHIGGPVFAATLMAILLTHEMGHYVTARRRGIDVSLPYFIPLPFIGMGTLGAVIKMRAPITGRDALAEVGASGPLAGLAVALPLLLIGLAHSRVGVVVGEPGTVQLIEGNSILYFLAKLAVTGMALPQGGAGAPLIDVELSPMAMAAWVGLLVTFINLIPIGQLDGGHVAAALLGDRHERLAPWLHRGLAVVGAVVLVVLALEARAAGREGWDAILYGATCAMPWLLWMALLLVLRRLTGGRYHPPVGAAPLSPSRRRLCILTAIVFLLLFTPVPLREALL